MMQIWNIVLIVCAITVQTIHSNKVCDTLFFKNQLTIRLAPGGYCITNDECIFLQNCTVLHGSLIMRQAMHFDEKRNPDITRIYPDFKKLREITGFLVITFFNDVFEHLPSLSVIRGNQLVANYAFIVYFNSLCKFIYLPNLTTILHGGVRINRNKILCYANTIRWKSIVKDKDQTSKYGIDLKGNNVNCDSACYSKRCYVGKGHGSDPTAQYCWGPGNENDPQCQRFCDTRCGLEGCVVGTTDLCCHTNCLGGCSEPNDPAKCDACKKYRIWDTGVCVNKCPPNTYLIDDLHCKEDCPGWQEPNLKRHRVLDGRCIGDCPAGYLPGPDDSCLKCPKEDDCPRICDLKDERTDHNRKYKGAIIQVPGDIVDKGLAGCTEINGSLTFEIAEGTGNIQQFTEKLKQVRIIRGYINIQKSAFKNFNFLSNLELIDPPAKQLIHGSYAIQIYDNKYLESLWTPKSKINVTRGKIFAQYNSRLCPKEIFKIQRSMFTTNDGNVSGDISMETNGNRVPCEVERLEFNVKEFTLGNNSFLHFILMPDPLMYLDCLTKKCLELTWNFNRFTLASYKVIFYQLYYRELASNEKPGESIVGDDTDNLQWKIVDVPHKFGIAQVGTVKKILKDLSPYAYYALFIKEVVTEGEERTSKIKYIRISSGIPSAPLGLEASFLSSQSIHLRWRKPDRPNGVITKYVIYWKRFNYSFWKDQSALIWCQRDIKSGVRQEKKKVEIAPQGECTANKTCVCEAEKEQSVAVKADREAYAFQNEFSERINQVIFTKKKGDKSTNRFSDVDLWNEVRPTPKQPAKIPLNKTDGKKTALIIPLLEKPLVRKSLEVEGDVYEYVVTGLEYFQDYEFLVCACTNASVYDGGCAKPNDDVYDSTVIQPCAVAQARTGVNTSADQLGGPVQVVTKHQIFNVTWSHPIKPNAIVLKYDVIINTGNNDISYCRSAKETFLTGSLQPGDYSVKIRAISPAGNGSWCDPVRFTIIQNIQESDNTLVLAISIGIGVLLIVLIGFFIYCACFKRLSKDSPGVLYASVNPEYMTSNEVYVQDEWELNRETIELIRELGKGSFGMVYEGIAHDTNGHAELRVAVKTVNENASIRERVQFLQEASRMKAFNSHHVVRLIGVVSQGQPTFVVMELMARGDLKAFLRSRRPEEKNPKLLPPMRSEILQMTAEIADGMAYLAARKVVHRDLAARNCMVAANFTVKIGDFGMARDIYETDYYRKGGKELLPVRWMAPESLRDGIFTTPSDVWSFGVVLWEIVTMAAQPYQGKSHEQVLKFILGGGVLEYPGDCDKQMQQLMEMCWSRDPKNRPSFLEVVRLLEDEVSEEFEACSFYHEMMKLTLEETLVSDGDLYAVLTRPGCTPKTGGKHKRRDSLSDDSGAFIDGNRLEADRSPSINSRKLFQPLISKLDSMREESGTNTPASNRSSQASCVQRHNKNSFYDNLEEDAKDGASPVVPGKRHSVVRRNEELDLNKIFGGGKAVAV